MFYFKYNLSIVVLLEPIATIYMFDLSDNTSELILEIFSYSIHNH